MVKPEERAWREDAEKGPGSTREPAEGSRGSRGPSVPDHRGTGPVHEVPPTGRRRREGGFDRVGLLPGDDLNLRPVGLVSLIVGRGFFSGRARGQEVPREAGEQAACGTGGDVSPPQLATAGREAICPRRAGNREGREREDLRDELQGQQGMRQDAESDRFVPVVSKHGFHPPNLIPDPPRARARFRTSYSQSHLSA
jgi:hypothetical protein